MVDYIKLLEQEPDIKKLVLGVLFETIIMDNPDMVRLIYTMYNAGISKDQIIIVIKEQMRIG